MIIPRHFEAKRLCLKTWYSLKCPNTSRPIFVNTLRAKCVDFACKKYI